MYRDDGTTDSVEDKVTTDSLFDRPSAFLLDDAIAKSRRRAVPPNVPVRESFDAFRRRISTMELRELGDTVVREAYADVVADHTTSSSGSSHSYADAARQLQDRARTHAQARAARARYARATWQSSPYPTHDDSGADDSIAREL